MVAVYAGCLLLLLQLLTESPLDAQEVEAEGCRGRNFGQDSVVCVCDSAHCDRPAPVPTPDPTHFSLVRSTRAGLRFDTSKHEIITTPVPGGLTLEVATASPQQTMLGFGASFTDAATINVHTLSPQTQDRLMRSYFGVDGLEYDLVRVPIAGTDFSTRPYSYLDDHHDLDHFALSPEDIQHKLPLLKKALELSRSPLRVIASPWSPPAWMKTNGKLNANGKLMPEMWQLYAQYIIRFLKEYEGAGVRMWGLTTQNHAFTTSYVKWNSCEWSPETMRDWVRDHLGPALKEAGLGRIRVMVGDEDSSKLLQFRSIVLGDEEASKYIHGVAVHWYLDFVYPPRELARTHHLFPDKFILYTEACIVASSDLWGKDPGMDVIGWDNIALGSWGRGEVYARSIIETSNHHVSGWMDWNFALDTQGGPNWAGNIVDAPIIINAEKDEFYKQPMYYAMGHFSKFVPSGSIAVPSWILVKPDEKALDKELHTAAFIHPSGHLVVVILNTGESKQVVNYKTDFGGYVSVTLTPRSLQTVLVALEEKEDHHASTKYTDGAHWQEGQC